VVVVMEGTYDSFRFESCCLDVGVGVGLWIFWGGLGGWRGGHDWYCSWFAAIDVAVRMGCVIAGSFRGKLGFVVGSEIYYSG